MRRTALLAAAVGGLMSSSAFAAYTFQFVKDAGPSGFDRYTLYALGTGAQAAENIFAADLTVTGAGNNDLKFTAALDTDGDDVPDTVPVTIGTVPTATRTRANNLVFQTIAPGYPTPPNSTAGGGDLAAYAAGIKTFQIVGFDGRTGGTGVAADAAQNAGKGAALLAAVVPTGATAPTITGQVSGLTGFIQTVVLDPTGGTTNVAPVAVSPAPQTVTFGQVVSNGTPFSATVTATDANTTDILTLAIGTLPAGVSGITIAPAAGSTSPASFTVTGTLAYSTNNSQVSIPFTVSDGAGGTAGGSIILNVVPEPTSLLALAGAAGLGMIRRRK